MKKLFYLVFIILFCINNSSAQKKLDLNFIDAVKYAEVYPKTLRLLKWRTNDSYSYLKDRETMVQQFANNDKTDVILQLQQLNNELERNNLPKLLSLNLSKFEWISENVIQFSYNHYFIHYHIIDKKIELKFNFKQNAANVSFCKQAKAIAYTVDNNLFMMNENATEIQITNDTDKGIVNGETVHRNEFGIDKGIFWSPKGTYLAFYRKDESMVTNYPLVDITKRIAEVENIKYPMVGEKSEEVTLGIYQLSTGKTIFIQTGEPKDQYLTSVTWDPSEKYIYIGILNREQNHLRMNKYDVTTGKIVKTLFEETNQKYVEPQQPLVFLTSNPNQFIWQSQRDGFNHLYLYDSEGTFIKQITQGKWIVTDFICFDKKEENVFIESTEVNPLERHIYSVNIKSLKRTKLTTIEGTHKAEFNSDKSLFFDDFSSTKISHKICINDLKGISKRTVLEAENPLVEYSLGNMTINTIKAADGITDLYYRLITPPDFDKNKKYPAIVYVYGGPHTQLITNTWLGSARLWEFYMAQQGYVVFVLDSRGSANRGFDFESAIHRNLGVNEMADQLKGVEFLRSHGYVDMNKLGLHGWSYGGFITVSFMTTFPDVFKVAVAGGPVIDWKYYEIMYGERYMDTPQENAQGYENANCLNKAKYLKGKLLIIHGAIDPTVVWQNSLRFLDECIKNKVQVDYFVYPRHEHNVRGADRVHLMTKVTQYFDDFLK